MMRLMLLGLAGAMLSSTTLAAAAQADAAPDPARARTAWAGTWKNGNNTMHVRAEQCGDAMCGIVVWADEQTKANIAAKGRTLIGTQVFRDFRQVGPTQWKGKVYVPAIDQTVAGKILLTDRDSITATGCLFQLFGCQTRHWARIR